MKSLYWIDVILAHHFGVHGDRRGRTFACPVAHWRWLPILQGQLSRTKIAFLVMLFLVETLFAFWNNLRKAVYHIGRCGSTASSCIWDNIQSRNVWTACIMKIFRRLHRAVADNSLLEESFCAWLMRVNSFVAIRVKLDNRSFWLVLRSSSQAMRHTDRLRLGIVLNFKI